MARVTGALRHTHKYYQKKNKRGETSWHCLSEGCTHFLPRNMGEPIGYKSICWGTCDSEFVLMPWHMGMEKPMCDGCAEDVARTGDYLAHRNAQQPKKWYEKQDDSIKPASIIQKKKPEPKPDEIEVDEPESE